MYQLKPVSDFLICLDLKEGASSLARNLWKALITMYESVDIMRQKDDLAFAQLLNRLRLKEMTEEDKQKLQTRLLTVIQVTTRRMLFIYLQGFFYVKKTQ